MFPSLDYHQGATHFVNVFKMSLARNNVAP